MVQYRSEPSHSFPVPRSPPSRPTGVKHVVTGLLRSEEAGSRELDSLNAKVERMVAPDLDGSDLVSAQNEPMPFRRALVQSSDTDRAAYTWSQPALSALSDQTAAR